MSFNLQKKLDSGSEYTAGRERSPLESSDSGAVAVGESVLQRDSIIYLDEDFAVVVKETGEVCEEGAPHSLSNRLRPLVEERLGHRVFRCECVHRLDQPVSGLCLLGLTEQGIKLLSQCFASRSVKKSYCAITERRSASLVQESPPAGEEQWVQLDCLMTFDGGLQKARIVKAEAGGKNNASLRYKVLGQGERYDFLLVEPLTGRSHQIRCQLAAIGRPIKGDLKYGAKRSEKTGGIRLHAWKLEFSHPMTGEKLSFTCLPPKMDTLWQVCTEFLR